MKRARRKRWIGLLGLAACAAALGIGLWGKPLLDRWATVDALRDARAMVAGFAGDPSLNKQWFPAQQFHLLGSNPVDPTEARTQSFEDRHRFLFSRGCIDPDYLIGSLPAAGMNQEVFAGFLVLSAYCSARKQSIEAGGRPKQIEEIHGWTRTFFRSAAAKELLVSLLIEDVEPLEGRKEPGGFLKWMVFGFITFRDVDDYGWGKDVSPETREFASDVLAGVSDADWRAVSRDCEHPRDRTRAGALLIFCHHPDRQVFLEKARKGLADLSIVVRIAAAGALAYHRNGEGQLQLIAGLFHPRWEVRWWCGKSLAYLGTRLGKWALRIVREIWESDPHTRREMGKMAESFPAF